MNHNKSSLYIASVKQKETRPSGGNLSAFITFALSKPNF